MDEIMRALVKKKPERDPDIPDMAQYMKEQNAFASWIRHMTLQPFNFGITAHILRIEDEDGEVTCMPGLAGTVRKVPLASLVCARMSIVGYLHVVEKKRKEGKGKRELVVMQTARSEKYYAKDRFGVLGSRLINPTIPEIEAAVRNGRSKQ
jgi:hypothetical protein